MKFTYFWMWLNETCCMNTLKQNDRPLWEDYFRKNVRKFWLFQPTFKLAKKSSVCLTSLPNFDRLHKALSIRGIFLAGRGMHFFFIKGFFLAEG